MMKYNGKTEVQGSWTRYNFDLSMAGIESIRIMISQALDRKDASFDEHTIGFAKAFMEVYHHVLLEKAGDETMVQFKLVRQRAVISKKVADDIYERTCETIKNANTYSMD